MEHERQKAERLRFARHQRHRDAAEPDRLFREIAALRVGACRIGPACRIGRVDGLQDGVEPVAEVVLLRHVEGNSGVPDPALGPHQPLAHRCRRHQERPGDGGGIEAEDGLEHQRRADRRVDRRVGADEHQPEPFVGNVVPVHVGLRFLGQQFEMGLPGAGRRPPPCRVDPAPARHCQQPRFRPVRDSGLRPPPQRFGEGLGQRVFRARHIAGAGGKIGDQLSVALPGGFFGGRPRSRFGWVPHQPACNSQTGLTSIVPRSAPGQREAHEIAASRSGASIM